jgi:hypothetical protein
VASTLTHGPSRPLYSRFTRSPDLGSLEQDGMMRTPILRTASRSYNGLQSRSSSNALRRCVHHPPICDGCTQRATLCSSSLPSRSRRAASSKTTLKLKDLPQGGIASQEQLLDINDSPAYPAVVQGAKNNMLKFENCVVLTRVGNFYEARFLCFWYYHSS